MSNENSPLALSPLDGRYRDKVNELIPVFSEFGLMRYRVRIEIAWLLRLARRARNRRVSATRCKREGLCHRPG